jgi:hypothetical protein
MCRGGLRHGETRHGGGYPAYWGPVRGGSATCLPSEGGGPQRFSYASETICFPLPVFTVLTNNKASNIHPHPPPNYLLPWGPELNTGPGTRWMVSLSPSKAKIFSPVHFVKTGFGAHPASYPMGNGGYFPGE